MLQITDQLDQQESHSRNDSAFFTLPFDKDDEGSKKIVHTWLINEVTALQRLNQDRFDNIKKNLAINKGLLYKDEDRKSSEDRDATKKREYTKIVANTLKKMNQIRASRLLKYKPAVAILPTNDEQTDKVAAETCENLIAHIWYEQRFDGIKLPKLVNEKGVMGEMYSFVTWNPELGDLHKSYKKAVAHQQKEKLEKVPLLTDDGQIKTDEKGNKIYIEKAVRNGDVQYTLRNPLEVLFERATTNEFMDSKYCFELETLDNDEARLRYPDAAKHIKGDKDFQFYDFEAGHNYTDVRKTQVYHFYHRRCSVLEKGRFISFTREGILSNKEFPYSHRQLPCVRWIDLTNPGEQHAISFFDDLRGKNGAYNNLTNMILRNEYLVGHPKWMMPAGAADIRELSNSITVVQYKGTTPPVLVQANPTGAGAYNLRQSFKEEIMEDSDVSRTGNGTPPAGITAAVALQYLSELEAERWNEPVLSHNESMLQLTKMTLAVAGDYYDTSDERMIRVQGEGNEWMSEMIDSAVLSKDYDVRVQNTSAVAESKSARIQTLMDLAEKFPEEVGPDQVLDMYEFAQSKKFVKEATISLRAAMAENEMFISGKPVGDPADYEDQIVHWKAHVRAIREWSFKNRTPPEVQSKITDHIMATEMLLLKLAAKSASIAAKLQTLDGFPLFYEGEATQTDDKAEIVDPTQNLGSTSVATLDQGPMLPPVDMSQGNPTGEPVNPEIPPLEAQSGVEELPQEPTNSV